MLLRISAQDPGLNKSLLSMFDEDVRRGEGNATDRAQMGSVPRAPTKIHNATKPHFEQRIDQESSKI